MPLEERLAVDERQWPSYIAQLTLSTCMILGSLKSSPWIHARRTLPQSGRVIREDRTGRADEVGRRSRQAAAELARKSAKYPAAPINLQTVPGRDHSAKSLEWVGKSSSKWWLDDAQEVLAHDLWALLCPSHGCCSPLSRSLRDRYHGASLVA